MADVELVIKIPEEIRTSLKWGVISDELIHTVCNAIWNGTPLPKRLEVLDKIRAEIEQDAFKGVDGWKYIFVNRVNQIIDKYKAESEDT